MRKHVAHLRLGLGLGLLLLSGPSSALAKPTSNTSTTAAGKQTKKARPPKEKAPCFAPEVKVLRRRGTEVEDRSLSLTFCDGKPNPAALDSLSVLARPRDVERPELAEIKAYQRLPVAEPRPSASERKSDKGGKTRRREANYLSERVMRVHPGLLERLQRVANRYPGKAIEILSGHRPDARDTSRHHHGRALDMRVAGVSREALRDFLRSFPETGVGYYPNSYFVHMDVREDKGYWVDRSGPGEAPDYGPWPPRLARVSEEGLRPKSPMSREGTKLVNQVLSELQTLEVGKLLAGSGAPLPREDSLVRALARFEGAHQGRVPEVRGEAGERIVLERALPAAAVEASDEEDADLDAEEIERIRKEARHAIEGL
jgi:hypothetical protein